MAQIAALRSLAGPLLAEAGLELWDVEASADVVRVLVDRPGGVDLDALSEASRVVGALLDDHDDLVPDGRYQLEVSSPGLERTLRTPDHYRRYVGTTVKVKTTAPVAGGRRHRGVLLAADDQGFELRPDAGGDPVRIRLADVERATTVFEWGPAPKPGGRRPPAAATASSPASAASARRSIPEPAEHVDPADKDLRHA